MKQEILDRWAGAVGEIGKLGREMEGFLSSQNFSILNHEARERVVGGEREKVRGRALQILDRMVQLVGEREAELTREVERLRFPLSFGSVQERLLGSQLKSEAWQHVENARNPSEVLDLAVASVRSPDLCYSLISWAQERFRDEKTGRLPWDWVQRIREQIDTQTDVATVLDEQKELTDLKSDLSVWARMVDVGVFSVQPDDVTEADRLGLSVGGYMGVKVSRLKRAQGVDKMQSQVTVS